MARDLNGTTQYLLGSSYHVQNVDTIPLSVSAFVYPDAGDVDYCVYSTGDGGWDGHCLKLNALGGSPGYVEAISYKSSQTQAQSTATWSIGSWQHVGAIWASNADRRVFYQGGNKGTDSTIRDVGSVTNSSIGNVLESYGAGWYLDGGIARLAVWAAILTDDEMAWLATGVPPWWVQPQNLLSFYPLLSTDQDWCQYVTMTAQNSPTWRAHPTQAWFPIMPAPFVSAGAGIVPLADHHYRTLRA